MYAQAVRRVVILVVVVTSPPAWGWGSAEHQEIGRTAYWRACTDLAAEISAKGTSGARTRFEMACGSNVQALADTYGDATAIAGDFLSEPSEFLSQAGAWRFSSKKSYLLLALENSTHFNPMAIGSWAEYHDKAIAEALAGAHREGLAVVAAYQLAIQESAFADHFLQDSFAAGHMGFNRTASSAAAAKSFHDSWNGKRAGGERSQRRSLGHVRRWAARPARKRGWPAACHGRGCGVRARRPTCLRLG